MEEKETIASMLLGKLRSTPGWMEQGACTDGELDPFDPADRDAFIREKCNKCPVIQQCREHFGDDDTIQGVFYGEDL